MMGLILMLIVAVAAFNIVATLVMVVSDKRTDIAILRTLGMSPRGVLAVFMTQGLLIGWLGTAHRRRARASRSRCTSTWSRRSSSTRWAFTSWTTRMSTTSPGLPSEMHPGDVIRIALAAMLLTLIATIYPALQAPRKRQPAEALALRMMRYWYEGLSRACATCAPRRKRGFVSLIAGIAILGLALGVAVLIVVLSVMNGFEEELRTRILSLTAHATIYRSRRPHPRLASRSAASSQHFPGSPRRRPTSRSRA